MAPDIIFGLNLSRFDFSYTNHMIVKLIGKIPNSYSVSLHSVLGRQVQSQNSVSDQKSEFTINMQSFPKGIYYLNVTSDTGTTVTKKVIKQ